MLTCRRGTSLCITVVILIVTGGVLLADAAAKDYYALGKACWEATDYLSAYDYLKTFRKQPNGRRPDVDYMLGTSGCRLPDRRAWGQEVLEWMPYWYVLSPQFKNQIKTQIEVCRSMDKTTLPHPPSGVPGAIPVAGVRGSPKIFYGVDQDVPINSYPARVVHPIGQQELESRIKPLDQKSQAIEKVQGMLARAGLLTFKVRGFTHFIIASASNRTQEQLEKIVGQLERFLSFLSKEYAITAPDSFITLYLAANTQEMQNVARKIHGLDVSPATIGYAFRDDLSVVAAIPGQTIGTLFHELFHLCVRNTFGNIPQWLDEGMAGLYEVYAVKGNKVVGQPNWRGRVLAQLWCIRPSLAELIQSDWFSEDMPDFYEAGSIEGRYPSVRKQAAYMATARYFAFYLQEKGRMAAVFTAFRDVEPGQTNGNIEAFTVKLVERTLNEPIATVQTDFDKWMQTVEKTKPPACNGTPSR